MASSNPVSIPAISKWIYNIKPKTILDVGCGFGRYGFLCREILEVWQLRYKKEEWKTKINAIEIFEPFITPMHEYLYDKITIGDIRHMDIADCDLIILGDILEHLPKNDAIALVRRLRKSAQWIIIQSPYGKMKQPAVFGNPAEEHLCELYPEDFNEYYGHVEINGNIFTILIRGEL